MQILLRAFHFCSKIKGCRPTKISSWSTRVSRYGSFLRKNVLGVKIKIESNQDLNGNNSEIAVLFRNEGYFFGIVYILITK